MLQVYLRAETRARGLIALHPSENGRLIAVTKIANGPFEDVVFDLNRKRLLPSSVERAPIRDRTKAGLASARA